jgi:aspartate beta-hydroxylase
MLAQLRFPSDAHGRVAFHAELVESACATRKFWVSKMQRPMHFYPKLTSQPWWDPSDFPWAMKLLQAYDEIRAEVLKMRLPATQERKAEVWDAVGSKHDAGDRELVENGAWTELVLLNRDEKVAAMVARNRRLCPHTLRTLDAIPAASDMGKRGVGESTFSALHSGAHLKPHCGSTNCRLTCHLPLIVPKGEVAIRVGDETRPYREGEMMIFDDSYEHEVWQLSKKEGVRVVLLIRFWHPDIPPNRWPEAFAHMKRNYVQHKRNIQLPPLERPSKLDATPVIGLKGDAAPAPASGQIV